MSIFLERVNHFSGHSQQHRMIIIVIKFIQGLDQSWVEYYVVLVGEIAKCDLNIHAIFQRVSEKLLIYRVQQFYNY